MKKLLVTLLAVNSISVFAAELSSHTVTIDNHPLHYYQMGNTGSPLVLLTGYATTSNFWPQDFVDCLAQRHRVYLIDYRGINTTESSFKENISINSMAKDTNQFVKQLNLKNVSLIGWSMGGAVALTASNNHQYQKLYLLAPLLPTSQPILYPFKTHNEFKSESDVLNYVFANNLYGYESAELNKQQSRFINPQLKTLFPSGEIIAKQSLAISQWQYESQNIREFYHNPTSVTFWLPQQDSIINEKIAESVIKGYTNKTIYNVKTSGHAVAWQDSMGICKAIAVR